MFTWIESTCCFEPLLWLGKGNDKISFLTRSLSLSLWTQDLRYKGNMLDSVPESFPKLFKMEGGPWGGSKVLHVGDQGYCGWIYEFLNFPAYIPDHTFSSRAAVLCFVFSVPTKHLIFFLSPYNLLSNTPPCSLPSHLLQTIAKDISPSETCHMLCCPTCPHPILPDSPLALVYSYVHCPGPCPFNFGYSGSSWNDRTHKRVIRVFYIFRNSPCVLWYSLPRTDHL